MTAPAATTPGTITVVNVRDKVPGAIYIGRYNRAWKLQRSPLANDYTVKEWGIAALSKYRQWLWLELLNGNAIPNSLMYRELCRLRDLVKAGESIKLACWCKVKGDEPCHGDVVKAAIEWMIREGK